MRTALVFSVVLIGTAAAQAADVGAPGPAAAPMFATRFGMGFDAHYVDQVDNNEGTYSGGSGNGSGWLDGAVVDFSLASNNPSGRGFQVDLSTAIFTDPPTNADDWTHAWLAGGLHLFTRNEGTSLWGIFGGGGIHNDTGDTDQNMYLWFAGVEGQFYRPNAVLFGQAGYIGSSDEYQEGLDDAGFLRLGGSYFLSGSTALKAAISGAYGTQDPSDRDGKASLADVQLELEHAYGVTGLSTFLGYEGTFVWVDRENDDVQTDFHALTVGLRVRTGAPDFRSATYDGASLDLPPVTRWVAYTANEVE
jgi:hypothetical protein